MYKTSEVESKLARSIHFYGLQWVRTAEICQYALFLASEVPFSGRSQIAIDAVA